MQEKKHILKKIKVKSNATHDIETERLYQNINRSDMEKLKLFTQMLRMNALYKKAKVTHKQ